MERIVDMKKSEFIMLAMVDTATRKNGSVTVSQISNEMRLSNAAISKTISELEDNGYIVKSINRSDKRKIHLELTEKGKEKLAATKKEMDYFFDAVFNRFGKDNTEKLWELVNLLYDITAEEAERRIKNKQNE